MMHAALGIIVLKRHLKIKNYPRATGPEILYSLVRSAESKVVVGKKEEDCWSYNEMLIG